MTVENLTALPIHYLRHHHVQLEEKEKNPTLLKEIEEKITELTAKISRAMHLGQEQILHFQDLSPTKCAQMIERTLFRQNQLKEEMIQRKENLLRLKEEIKKATTFVG